MKYIILKIDGVETPVLFAEHVSHLHVARGICSQIKDAEQVRAGFCEAAGPVSMSVGGESNSLLLRSDAGDAETIRHELVRPSLTLAANRAA
jgi:hypothetical protein